MIHPEFIDEIQFYPGGAPAPYGGYTGGIIDGRTARANARRAPDRRRCQPPAGRRPRARAGRRNRRHGHGGGALRLPGVPAVARDRTRRRCRTGTTSSASTAAPRRTAGRCSRSARNDELDTVAAERRSERSEPAARAGADPRLSPPRPALSPHVRQARDHVRGSSAATTTRSVDGHRLHDLVGRARAPRALQGRQDAHVRRPASTATSATSSRAAARTPAAGSLAAITRRLVDLARPARPSSRRSGGRRRDWLIRPGVRGDVYHDTTATKPAIDPRLTVRYKLGERDLPDVAPDSDDARSGSRASTGIYHQPPRFVLPLPGLDEMPLKYGLLAVVPDQPRRRGPARHSLRSSRPRRFFNYMDPTIFDLSINAATRRHRREPDAAPDSIIDDAPTRAQMFIDRLTTPQLGRAYGLEVLLRRQAQERRVRLDLVHAVARRALSRRRVGAVRLRSHAPVQPRGRPAAAPQLGPRRAHAVPERPARDDDRRLQHRARRRLRAVRRPRRQARRLSQAGCSTSTSTSRTSRCCPRRSRPATRSATCCPRSACAAGSEGELMTRHDTHRRTDPRPHAPRGLALGAVAADRARRSPRSPS